MKDVTLELSYFEMGVLIGSLKNNVWDKMPRSLWLKLHIASTKAYIHHKNFGDQARKDIEKWKQELLQIEGGDNDENAK